MTKIDAAMMGKAERSCVQCGANISGKTTRAKYCSGKCKQRCNASKFSARDREIRRLYSKEYYKENSDASKANRKLYVAENYANVRAADGAYYQRNKLVRTEYQRKWTQMMKDERPHDYQAFLRDQSERSRRRASDRALSMILLPIHSLSEA